MGFVRRLPTSRLQAIEDQELLTEIGELSLADVLLTVRYRNQSAKKNSAAKNRQEVTLLAATPVFDETTGNIFGLVTIELDLQGRVIQVLERLEQSSARIFVTDTDGHAWVSDDPVAGINTLPEEMNATAGQSGIPKLFSDGAASRILEQSEGWIANRITLDPSNPQTTLGLILELVD